MTERDFTDAGRQLDRMPGGIFARYGLRPADMTAAGAVRRLAAELTLRQAA